MTAAVLPALSPARIRRRKKHDILDYDRGEQCSGQQRSAQPVPWNLLILRCIPADQDIGFILVIAALVQLVDMFLKKTSRAIYEALGIYLPLITTNCAVLGVALTNVQNGYNLLESVLCGFGTALGYTIAIVLLAGIRGRLDEEAIPAPFRGAPIVLLCAALMSIAFMGFSGL